MHYAKLKGLEDSLELHPDRTRSPHISSPLVVGTEGHAILQMTVPLLRKVWAASVSFGDSRDAVPSDGRRP